MKLKRILASLLALTMILTLCPVVFADEATQPLEDTVITVWNMGSTASNKHSLLTKSIGITTRAGVSPSTATPNYNKYEDGSSRSAVYYLKTNQTKDDLTVAEITHPSVGSNYKNSMPSGVTAGSCLTVEQPVVSIKYKLLIPNDAKKNEKRAGGLTEVGGKGLEWTYQDGYVGLWYGGVGNNDTAKSEPYEYTPGTWMEIKILFKMNTDEGNACIGGYAKSGDETEWTQFYYAETSQTTFTDLSKFSLSQFNITQIGSLTDDTVVCTTYYDYMGLYATAEEPSTFETTAEKIVSDLAEISLPASGRTISENLTLPTQGTKGTVFTWTSSNPDVLSNDGKITTPEETTSVTLTLNATCGTANKVVEYTYKVAGFSTTLLKYEMKKSNIDASNFWDWTRDESGEIILNDNDKPTGDLNSKGVLVNREGYHTTDLFGYPTARGLVSRTSGEITGRNLVMSSYTKAPTNFVIGDDEILEIRTKNVESKYTALIANIRTSMPKKFSANESTLEYSYDIYVDEASKAATRMGEINFAGSDINGNGRYDSTELTFGANIGGEDAALSFYSSASQTAKVDYTTYRNEKVNVAVDTMVNVKYIFKVTDLGDKYRIKAYGLYNDVCYFEEVAYVDGNDFAIVSIAFDLFALKDIETFTKLDNITLKHYAAGYDIPIQYGWDDGSDYAYLSPITFNETSKVANVAARVDGHNGKACVILAMYNKNANDRLVKTYIDSNLSDGLSVSSDASHYQDGYYFKAFLVDSLSTVNPYTANKQK